MRASDQLITKVNIPDFHPKIRYQDAVFMAGSCFAEHISDKLDRYKYGVLSNPFGILYNPVSLARSLDRISNLIYYSPDELLLYDGYYHSMDHHGSFSGKDKQIVTDKINKGIETAHQHLKKCAVAFISPGTARVYRYKETSAITGNNHKIPSAAFSSEQLSVEDCVDAFEKIFASIERLSPDARIIWTLSPVRHIRDGLIENQRSKATLLLAIDEVTRTFPETSYFPAYEIMMDELRDYRYYERDLIHPSPLAIDIIWDLFSNAYLDPKDREYHPLIEKIQRAKEHRFLHDDHEAIRTFAAGQLNQIDELAFKKPELNWQRERQYFFQYLELD
jgi:hypothetical protein